MSLISFLISDQKTVQKILYQVSFFKPFQKVDFFFKFRTCLLDYFQVKLDLNPRFSLWSHCNISVPRFLMSVC